MLKSTTAPNMIPTRQPSALKLHLVDGVISLTQWYIMD